jgi:hypothetical protein
MNQKEHDIQRKLRMLKHAQENGNAVRTCRYFGVVRVSFCLWKSLYKKDGEAGMVNKKPIPKNPTNRTLPEVVEKVLHLRQTYRLGLFGSSGISLAIMTSKYQMQVFIASSSATV